MGAISRERGEPRDIGALIIAFHDHLWEELFDGSRTVFKAGET
jgi:hypothetical protein